MTCLTILGAAHSAAKNKKLETEDVLDNVAKHQSVLEEALREHREEIKRLRIRELPEDLFAAASFQTRRGNAIDATPTAQVLPDNLRDHEGPGFLCGRRAYVRASRY